VTSPGGTKGASLGRKPGDGGSNCDWQAPAGRRTGSVVCDKPVPPLWGLANVVHPSPGSRPGLVSNAPAGAKALNKYTG